jgi:hypothetical protein
VPDVFNMYKETRAAEAVWTVVSVTVSLCWLTRPIFEFSGILQASCYTQLLSNIKSHEIIIEHAI